MFGSVTLEIAIGIILIFLLVSIMCSTIREVLESLLKTRSAYLERGIRELLQDKDAKGLVESFYKHPLISSLFSEHYVAKPISKSPSILAMGRNLPSYIPSKNFALALMDIATRGRETDEVSSDPESPVMSLPAVRQNVLNIENSYVQRAMLIAIDSAQGNMDVAVKNLENWFNSGMDRVSGWYRRSTQWIIFWVALIVSVGLNVNTITIANYLYHSDVARKALIAKAEVIAKDSTYQEKNFKQINDEIKSLNLPIGWGDNRVTVQPGAKEATEGPWNDFFLPVLGWLITALAATMGAPFWFDLLNKIMIIRSTVKPHEKSPEESSEDRQSPKPVVPQVGVIAAQPQHQVQALQPLVVPPAPPAPAVSSARDAESSVDGCDVEINTITPDEELPPAKGGVG